MINIFGTIYLQSRIFQPNFNLDYSLLERYGRHRIHFLGGLLQWLDKSRKEDKCLLLLSAKTRCNHGNQSNIGDIFRHLLTSWNVKVVPEMHKKN